MVIAMALMTGYRDDLEGKLIRGNAAVIAYPVGGKGTALDAGEARRGGAPFPACSKIGEVAYGQGSLASRALPQGIEVVLRGVDAGGGQLGATRADLAPAADGIPRAVLGQGARPTGCSVRPGDPLRLVALGFAGDAAALPLPEPARRARLLDRLRRVRPHLDAARPLAGREPDGDRPRGATSSSSPSPTRRARRRRRSGSRSS